MLCRVIFRTKSLFKETEIKVVTTVLLNLLRRLLSRVLLFIVFLKPLFILTKRFILKLQEVEEINDNVGLHKESKSHGAICISQ